MSSKLATFILIFFTSAAFAGPGLDIRPQMSTETPAAEDQFQTLDMILADALNLTCEASEARCMGESGLCGQATDAVSCVDMDESLQCKWACE